MIAWVVAIDGRLGRWYFRYGRGTAKGSKGRWNPDVSQAKIYWAKGTARRVATNLAPGVAEAVEVRCEFVDGFAVVQLKGSADE